MAWYNEKSQMTATTICGEFVGVGDKVRLWIYDGNQTSDIRSHATDCTIRLIDGTPESFSITVIDNAGMFATYRKTVIESVKIVEKAVIGVLTGSK